MKLFVFAALVAAASAGRLEHLERSYLPPDNNVQNGNGFASGTARVGVSGHNTQGFGLNGASHGFGSNGQGSFGFDSNGHGASHGSNGFGASQGSTSSGLDRNGAFDVATSNQYLPPNHSPSGSSNFNVHQFESRIGSNGFGSLGSQNLGSQHQFGDASRQYLAPKYTSQQTQQPFDVNFGYIY